MKNLTKNAQLIVISGATAAAAGGVYLLTAFEGMYKVSQVEEREKVDNYINASLNECLIKAKRGEYHDALRSALRLNVDNLNRKQLRTRLILIGDINKHFYDKYSGSNDAVRAGYIEKAADYYKRAREEEYSPSINSRKEIARRIANLYISDGDWENAYKTFEENESLDVSAEERWRTRLHQADCLLKYDKPKYFKAIKILSQIADDDDCDEIHIWGEALRKKSVLLYQATQDPAIMKEILASGQEGQPAATEDEITKYKAEFLKEAKEGFQMILDDELLFNSPQRSYAELGIMRIYVAQKDKEKAYEWANDVHFSSGTDAEKAEALYLLAVLESTSGNKAEAIKVLNTSIDRYEKPAFMADNARMLFELYKDDKQYENAFNIMSRLMTEYTNKDRVHSLTQDFLPGDERLLTKITQLPIPDSAKDYYYKRAAKLLQVNRDLRPEIWRPVKQQWSYMDARIAYLQKDWKTAEETISEILNGVFKDDSFKEMTYKLDLQCAEKQDAPEIAICRAERYMRFYPQGEYSVHALNVLQDAYFNMGLFEPALDISKKMYVTGLNRMRSGLQTTDEKSLWLNTVAKIGRCYYKLGIYDKAEQLLRSYSKELLKQPDVGSIYTDWAGIALVNGQEREAMRRLDVAIPRTKDTDSRTSMRVARNLLKLKRNKEIDYFRTASLFEKIRETESLTPEVKKELLQELGETLLEYNYTKRPKLFKEFLDKMLVDFKGESWLEYWLLKSLSPLLGTAELTTLAREHQKTLENEFTGDSKKTPAYEFLKNQLDLINSLTAIDKKYDKFTIRQNGALYDEQDN